MKRRIPTIIGLLLLVAGAVAGILFIGENTSFLPRASPEYLPQRVKITNVSDTSFAISWFTESPTVGFVKYGTNAGNLDNTAVDDRDQLTGSSGDYRSHYISVQGLTPSTTYFFKLGSANKQLYDSDGQAFTINTPASLATLPPADTIYGTILTAANTPAEGAIVYISMEGAIPQSALVKQNGNWAANLSFARALSLASLVTYDPTNTVLTLLVEPPTGEVTTVTTTTGNDQPVPPITLGQSSEEIALSPTPTSTPVDELPEATPEILTEPTPIPDSKFSFIPVVATDLDESAADPTLRITTPVADGAVVTTNQPEITGKAPAGTTLTITIHSPTAYTDQVVTAEDGVWRYIPAGALEPGEHTVTIAYTDTEGILHKTTKMFVVANVAGSGAPLDILSYSASPSASPKASPTPSPSPSPSPTITPSPKPSSTPLATPRTVSGTASASIKAGVTYPTWLLLLAGFISIGAGLYLSKGKQAVQ